MGADTPVRQDLQFATVRIFLAVACLNKLSKFAHHAVFTVAIITPDVDFIKPLFSEVFMECDDLADFVRR